MSNEINKYFCPRLIDFIIVVGCKEPATPSQLLAKHLQKQKIQQHFSQHHYEQTLSPELKQSQQSAGSLDPSHSNSSSHSAYGSQASHNQPPPLAQIPELLRRYPLADHNDFMLPQDVIFFCQPEGCININCSSQQKANSNKDTTSFIFTLTEKDSARVRYGVCINFFRPIERKHEHSRHKSRNNNNKSAASSGQKNEDSEDELAGGGGNEKSNKRSVSRGAKEETSGSSHSANKSTKQHRSSKKRRNKKASDIKYTHTLTSLCIISHHPFFSIFRECLNILRRIIESCHARSLALKLGNTSNNNANNESQSGSTLATNNKQQNNAGRDTVWGILTGSSGTISTDQISSLIACEIREIETWILRLLSAPVPVPGKTKLIVNFLLLLLLLNLC
jgi:hypothetical protein